MSLSELRKRIDTLDEKIIRLLNQRADIVLRIGHVKKGAAHEVYVPAREKKVLNHVRKVNEGPLGDAAILAIYREIMSGSRALERDIGVAYLGPPSTFTHQAVYSRFGGSVKTVACETISDVFNAVECGQTDYGVVPIENSTEGAVTHTLDEFVGTSLKICAEIYLRISHHLMARVPLAQVKRIVSHPQVFGQCRSWLHKEMPHADLVPVTSTAKAAEKASREKHTAAIAGVLVGETYGLNVLASDIQDISGNMTRFLVIGRNYGKATGEDKSSILFSVKHEAGALHSALGSLKRCGLNMTKIESRPSRLKAWEYFFFVDIAGHIDEEPVAKALRDLEKHCVFMTVLGSYPRQNVES
ncbi:prephenate dehydratase [Verrucomicrobiota bacterium]